MASSLLRKLEVFGREKRLKREMDYVWIFRSKREDGKGIRNMFRVIFTFSLLGLALITEFQRSRKAESHASPVEANLLETGHASKLRGAPVAPEKIKIVSYNIRWRGGAELQQLARLLKEDPEIGDASVLALQEVDRNRTRTGQENTAKVLAHELGMHYAWAAPPKPRATDEEETGVLLLSAYPISDVTRIVLPHEGPNHRRRVGIGGTVKIGDSNLRLYSVHAETRLAMDKKLDQLKAILDDLNQHPKNMPAIVLGDLNTWEPGAGGKIS